MRRIEIRGALLNHTLLEDEPPALALDVSCPVRGNPGVAAAILEINRSSEVAEFVIINRKGEALSVRGWVKGPSPSGGVEIRVVPC